VSKLEIMTGRKVGVLVVLERGPNLQGPCDTRVQWWCECTKCDEEVLIAARTLKSKNNRYTLGCYLCKKSGRGSKVLPNSQVKGVRYGRNINGFIDRSIILKEGELL